MGLKREKETAYDAGREKRWRAREGTGRTEWGNLIKAHYILV